MKKIFSLLATAGMLLTANSQKVSGNLKFTKGQQIQVTSDVKSLVTQEAMGQTIEINVNGNITTSYDVTEAAGNTAILNHKTNRVVVSMEGMGQNQSFDSDKTEDRDGPMGAPIKDILNRSYLMTLDETGKITEVKETKADQAQGDAGADMLGNLLKTIGSNTETPKTGKGSFFQVLPAKEIAVGDTWTDSSEVEGGMETINYKLAGVTDTEILVDYTTLSTTQVAGEMMGMETVTNMTNKTTGKIILDKATGIIKQRNSATESTGTVDVMGQSIPITNKTTSVVNVKF